MTYTAGNSRNGVSTQTPIFMTNMAGTHQYGALIRTSTHASDPWGIMMWDRTIATDSYSTYDLSGSICATVAPAVYSAAGKYLTPINPQDDHWGVAVGVDSQDRIHLFGNSQRQNMHYFRSGAASISTWTDVATDFTKYQTMPWCRDSNAAHNSHTYNSFARLSDGTLLHLFNRNPSTTNTRGTVTILAYLPPGAGTTWLSHGGASAAAGSGWGNLSQAQPSAVPHVDACVAYANSIIVDSNDRVHVCGSWRLDDSDPDYATRPWYMYTDDITADAWKAADGTSVTTPLTWANTTGANNSDLTVQSAPQWLYGGMTSGLSLDANGYPSLVMPNGDSAGNGALGAFPTYAATGANVRCYWDGSAWQVTDFARTPFAYTPSHFSLGVGRSHDMYVTESVQFLGERRTQVTNNASIAPKASWRMGGINAVQWNPQPEMVHLAQNQLDLFIPDGDTPKVYSFGNHFKCVAD